MPDCNVTHLCRNRLVYRFMYTRIICVELNDILTISAKRLLYRYTTKRSNDLKPMPLRHEFARWRNYFGAVRYHMTIRSDIFGKCDAPTLLYTLMMSSLLRMEKCLFFLIILAGNTGTEIFIYGYRRCFVLVLIINKKLRKVINEKKEHTEWIIYELKKNVTFVSIIYNFLKKLP